MFIDVFPTIKVNSIHLGKKDTRIFRSRIIGATHAGSRVFRILVHSLGLIKFIKIVIIYDVVVKMEDDNRDEMLLLAYLHV